MAKTGGASRRRIRVLPTVLLTVAILGLPAAVYAWGRTSSSFEIKHVRVSGTDMVRHRRVVKTLRADFQGGNLFKVTTADVRASLHSLAYVKDVVVDRDFPDTLKVKVVEHDPALYVLGANGWFTVADDGFVICRAGAAPTSGAGGGPSGVVSAGSGGGSKAGDAASPAATASATASAAAAPAASASDTGSASTSSGPPSAVLTKGPPHAALRLPALAVDTRLRAGATLSQTGVGAALRVLGMLPAGSRRVLKTIQVAPQGGLTLRFDGGPDVRWGDRQRSLAKTLALEAVLAAYRDAGKRATYVDVSVPDRVLARPILK